MNRGLAAAVEHRPELDQRERPAVKTRALLAKEHWATESQGDQGRDSPHYGAEQ
jgi:hypothetical protein